MSKVLTIQTILDEDTKIETIVDKETLRKVLSRIIGVSSYSKIKREDMVEVMEKIYKEFNIR